MPIKCPGGLKPRYRFKGKVRLAFCGNRVMEAKNPDTGDTHTPAEFKQDRLRQKAKSKNLGR